MTTNGVPAFSSTSVGVTSRNKAARGVGAGDLAMESASRCWPQSSNLRRGLELRRKSEPRHKVTSGLRSTSGRQSSRHVMQNRASQLTQIQANP